MRYVYALFAAIGLTCCVTVAWAQEPNVPPEVLSAGLDEAKLLVEKVMSGDWREEVALALILIVGLQIRYRGQMKRIPGIGKAYGEWLKTDLGGTVFAFGTSTLGALATAMLADPGGGMVSFELLKTSVIVGFNATAGYTVLWKRVAKPILRWAWEKIAG